MNTLTVNQFAAQHEIELDHALYILDKIFEDPGIETKAKSSTSPYFIAAVELGAPDLIAYHLNAYYGDRQSDLDADATADDESPALEAEEIDADEAEEIEETEDVDLDAETDQLNALNALSTELTMKEYRRRLIEIASAHGDAVAFVNRHIEVITAQLEALGLKSLENQKAKLFKEARIANK